MHHYVCNKEEINHFRMTGCLWNLFLWLILLGKLVSGQTGLPEVRLDKTNCFKSTGDVHGRIISPFCATGTRIAVDSLKYGCPGKSKCYNITTNSVPNYTLEAAVRHVSGLQGAAHPIATSLCNDADTLMSMSYYCINDSRILEVCTDKTVSSRGFLYLASSNYPNSLDVNNTDCTCAVSIAKNTHKKSSANITMVTIHAQLKSSQQLIVSSRDGGFTRKFTKDASQYAMSFQQVPYSDLEILWHSNGNRKKGLFWIGFQNSDTTADVSMSCKKQQANLSTKPVTFSTSTATYPPRTRVPSTSIPNTKSSSVESLTERTYRKTSSDKNLAAIIGGVVGGILLLLLIIIIIVCLMQKKQSTKEKVKPQFDEENLHKGPLVDIPRARYTSRVPSLPPISGSMLAAREHNKGITNGTFSSDQKHSLDDQGDEDKREKRRKKRARRKKEKRWTDRVTYNNGDFREISPSPKYEM